MYFADPKEQAEFDARHPGTCGVVLKDHSKRIYREVQKAIRERRPLLLRWIPPVKSREQLRLERRK